MSLEGGRCFELGDSATNAIVLENRGGLGASDVQALVTLPAGVTFVSGPGCLGAGAQVTCDGGTLSAGARHVIPLTLSWPGAPGGARRLSVVASTSAADLNTANDTSSLVVGLTGPGVQPIPIGSPRVMDALACFGTMLTSYAQCTPPSLSSETLWIEADGGVANDGGVPSVWDQAQTRRNLCFEFLGPSGGLLFYGVAVSPTCFEGLIDNVVVPEPAVGAWRGCLR